VRRVQVGEPAAGTVGVITIHLPARCLASKALAQRGTDDKYGTALGDTYSRDRS